MKLLVVIVTYNGTKWLDNCLGSVIDSSIKGDILVVDNGSTDGTIEYLKTNYPDIKLFLSQSNLGFGQANNIGMRYGVENDYDYIYLLNQDAWVERDTFHKLIEVNKANPNFGILSPLQKTAAKASLDRNFSIFCPPTMISDALCGDLKELYQANFIMAAHWMVSRKCVESVGGFSPTFPHYGEDDNYIDRCHNLGFKVGIVTSVSAVHDRENRTMTEKQRLYRGYIGNLVMLSDFTTRMKFLKFLNNSLMQFVNNPKSAKYFFKILFNYGKIRKNRRISKNGSAFL